MHLLAQVYDSLFDAAVIVVKSAGTGVVDVVDHRYGEDAGEVTKNSL